MRFRVALGQKTQNSLRWVHLDVIYYQQAKHVFFLFFFVFFCGGGGGGGGGGCIAFEYDPQSI